MSRKQSREVAFKLLFSLAFDKDSEVITDQMIELACDGLERGDRSKTNKTSEEKPDETELKYIKKLCAAVKNNLGNIDGLISSTAKGFSFDRIFKVDLTALRLAVGEILYMDETPDIVAVNEAVNLVKKYGTATSASYINGILATILESKGQKMSAENKNQEMRAPASESKTQKVSEPALGNKAEKK